MVEDVAPGAIVAQRYRLERLLGQGGMGEVWAATHVTTRKAVALKFLKVASAARADARRRFAREARAASAVRHPNVVEIHDVLDLDGALPVMVMDLLEGENLAARLSRVGRLSVEEAATILLPVISAVGTAHALGIVHRDLKPDNIFLDDDRAGGFTVKVLDFGIAKLTATHGDAAETGVITGTGAMLGTPYYMSPEQAFGEKDVDHRADIWALGVILYECLSGQRPFSGDNFGQILKGIMTGNVVPIDELVPDLPEPVVALVGRLLSLRRERRPSDLREVRDVLAAFSTVVVRPFGPPQFDLADSGAEPQQPGPAPNTRIIVSSGTTDPDAPTGHAAIGETPPAQTNDPHAIPAPGRTGRSRVGWIAIAGGAGLLAAVAVFLPSRGSTPDHDALPSAAAGPSVAPEPAAPSAAAPRELDAPGTAAAPVVSAAAPEAPTTVTPDVGAHPKKTPSSGMSPRVAASGPARPPTPARGAPAVTPAPPPAAPTPAKGGILEKPPF